MADDEDECKSRALVSRILLFLVAVRGARLQMMRMSAMQEPW